MKMAGRHSNKREAIEDVVVIVGLVVVQFLTQLPKRISYKLCVQLLLLSFGGLEKIELACRYSRAKIVGTLLCVFGAVVLSLMQSTVRVNECDAEFPSTRRPHVFFDKQTMLGCVYLIASVVIFSSQVVLQAGSVSGMCVSFNSWAMKKRGPVIVSIFNPLATVISAIFSILTFGESISVG
ncbi:UNVERIFIED_CONTAM: WAT1-related protein, partial [Sesamum latifolium]